MNAEKSLHNMSKQVDRPSFPCFHLLDGASMQVKLKYPEVETWRHNLMWSLVQWKKEIVLGVRIGLGINYVLKK